MATQGRLYGDPRTTCGRLYDDSMTTACLRARAGPAKAIAFDVGTDFLTFDGARDEEILAALSTASCRGGRLGGRLEA